MSVITIELFSRSPEGRSFGDARQRLIMQRNLTRNKRTVAAKMTMKAETPKKLSKMTRSRTIRVHRSSSKEYVKW